MMIRSGSNTPMLSSGTDPARGPVSLASRPASTTLRGVRSRGPGARRGGRGDRRQSPDLL